MNTQPILYNGKPYRSVTHAASDSDYNTPSAFHLAIKRGAVDVQYLSITDYERLSGKPIGFISNNGDVETARISHALSAWPSGSGLGGGA